MIPDTGMQFNAKRLIQPDILCNERVEQMTDNNNKNLPLLDAPSNFVALPGNAVEAQILNTTNHAQSIRDVTTYGECVYEPGDIIEVRMLADNVRPVAQWFTASELPTLVDDLAERNETGLNIYVGANPRTREGGSKATDVTITRCLFADFDGGVDAEEAARRISVAGLPTPTLTLNSGHGVHAYWRMTEPVEPKQWLAAQQALIVAVDSDPKPKDLPRIMRLPGFFNRKPDMPPVLSHIVEADPTRRYEFDYLRSKLDRAEPELTAETSQALPPIANEDSVLDRARRYIAKIPGAVSGQGGHNATFGVACRLVVDFDLSPNEAFPLIKEWNSTCQPPWRDADLLHKLNDADRQPEERGRLRDESVHSEIGLDKAPNRTEVSNAKRFTERFGEDIRWVAAWNTWMIFDGKCWVKDQSCAVEGHMQDCMHDLWNQFALKNRSYDDSTRKAVIRFIITSNTAHAVRDALTLAKSDLAITVDKFDADPWLFNVANGTIDLRTNQLKPHDRQDFITKLCPIDYDESAECPTWCRFVDEVFNGDSEIVAYVQRLVGYSLTGCQREQILPICFGTGCNGKSVFLNTLLNVLGPSFAMKADRTLLMATRSDQHPTNVADLYGKRFVAAIETESGRQLNESLVKELTGGDRVRARRMREDFWEFSPTHTIWLATNHRPVINGTDNGIWRRLRLIPFNVSFFGREDSTLSEKLKEEAAGILAWAMAGARDYLSGGLRDPEKVLAATRNYREEQDILGQFIREQIVEDTESKVKMRDIYGAYQQWCMAVGESPSTLRSLGMALTEREIEKRTSNGVVYLGIRLLSN